MSKRPAISKEIEEYLSGELPPEHVAEFEKRLREDEDLQKELEITRRVIEGIEGYGFKQMLKRFHKQYFNKDGTPGNPKS